MRGTPEDARASQSLDDEDEESVPEELSLPPALPTNALRSRGPPANATAGPRLGTGDVPGRRPASLDESGMLMGPGHPAFSRGPAPGGALRHDPTRLPPGAVPPGARFDPIYVRPGARGPSRPPQGTGEPDPDELPPPGPRDDDRGGEDGSPSLPFARPGGGIFPGPGRPPFF